MGVLSNDDHEWHVAPPILLSDHYIKKGLPGLVQRLQVDDTNTTTIRGGEGGGGSRSIFIRERKKKTPKKRLPLLCI